MKQPTTLINMFAQPKAAQRARDEGRLVNIMRPSKWGNPFRLHVDTPSNRALSIQLYEARILERPELMAALHELDGMVLACCCKPKPCHGDILIQLVNQRRIVSPPM